MQIDILILVKLSQSVLFSDPEIQFLHGPRQDSTVYIHLKEKGHSLKDDNMRVLHREDRWFEKGVKKVIYVKLE